MNYLRPFQGRAGEGLSTARKTLCKQLATHKLPLQGKEITMKYNQLAACANKW